MAAAMSEPGSCERESWSGSRYDTDFEVSVMERFHTVVMGALLVVPELEGEPEEEAVTGVIR